MGIRSVLKKIAQFLSLAFVFPAAAVSGFGRIQVLYTLFAQSYALAPGIFGSYFRAAYYHWTLRDCAIDVTIGFGTIFVHPETIVGSYTAIGNYCMIGKARIGRRTQIASHVEIPSGRHQHQRDANGNLGESMHGETVIGDHCWIGSSAVIMATVGDGSTIGAGAVVVKDIPANVLAVGNPARVVRSLSTAT
jgi:virginiamycin A acetyltransferase